MRAKLRILLALVAILLAPSIGRTTLGASARAAQPDRATAAPAAAQSQAAASLQTPEQFFGFKPGTDGELARYPKVLEYFQLVAKSTDRVKYEELGKTTMGNSYALLRISCVGACGAPLLRCSVRCVPLPFRSAPNCAERRRRAQTSRAARWRGDADFHWQRNGSREP